MPDWVAGRYSMDSFETRMFGWKGALTAAQTARIANARQVTDDGFRAAIAGEWSRTRPAYWSTNNLALPHRAKLRLTRSHGGSASLSTSSLTRDSGE